MRLRGKPPTWMLSLCGDPVFPLLNATSRALKGLGWVRGLNRRVKGTSQTSLTLGLLSRVGFVCREPTLSPQCLQNLSPLIQGHV